MATAASYTQALFDNLDSIQGKLQPLWALPDLNDEKEVLKTLKVYVDVCEDYYSPVFQTMLDNLLLFKGIQWLNQDLKSNRFLDRYGSPTRKSPRVVINYLYDFTEQRVSKLTRFKPAVAINPTNEEYSDLVDAKVSKYVLDHIWYQQKKDQIEQEFVRQGFITGEGHKYITWNPHKGDVHPDYVAAAQSGARVPVIDQRTGQPVMSTDNKPLYIQQAVKTGDVDCKVVPAWKVFEQPCRHREDIEWEIVWDTADVNYLKAKYPEKADKIKTESSSEAFTKYRLDIGKLKTECIVYTLYHKSSEFLDKGRYIKFTKDCILENTDLPYRHGQIPKVRFADIDVPDHIRGMSFYQQLYPLQHQINACASLIYKALVLFAHPKWVVPDSECDIRQLENDSTVVTFSGPIPPQLLVNNPVAPHLFAHLEKLEQQIGKLAGVYPMSQGEAPSGVRAASALRLLKDQEEQRAYVHNIKYSATIVEDAKLTLAVAGDYYDDSDGRLARVLGKGNEFLIKNFRSANLSKPYDIRIENTTALSQSLSGRIEDILDLNRMTMFGQSAPGLFTREEVIDLLDLGQADKMKDLGSADVRCAESENEDFEQGIPVAEPEDAEDLIIHWKVHRRPMRTRVYKAMWPDANKELLREHVLTTEYKMAVKAENNATYLTKLKTELPEWPLYFPLPPGWPLVKVSQFVPPPMMGMGAGAPLDPSLGGPASPMGPAPAGVPGQPPAPPQPAPLPNPGPLPQGGLPPEQMPPSEGQPPLGNA